ncbi:unnamed protein product [Vicia faba]|uniref:Auxin-induced protein n=1 Tax=Vicia faba TaxID=3906 RepID=A0AAV1AVL8_VICFA|nr:unnamed protein product [Vicia faba]
MKSFIERDLIINHEDTELRLGLPGNNDEHSCNIGSIVRSNKRSFSPETSVEESSICNASSPSTTCGVQQPSKVQVVGWPPIRSFRKNSLQQKKDEEGSGMYVKVSMAGAPYLRKIDLKLYKNYSELLIALENLFNCTFGKNHSGEHAPTYEDKDGDWMLVGDVPWNMFVSSCKRLKIVKRPETMGLACLRPFKLIQAC